MKIEDKFYKSKWELMEVNRPFYSTSGSKITKRVARVYHECIECGCEIEPNNIEWEITYQHDDYRGTVYKCNYCWCHN